MTPKRVGGGAIEGALPVSWSARIGELKRVGGGECFLEDIESCS